MALRPGQRLALACVLLQEALQRTGESGAHLPRKVPPGRGGAARQPGHRPVGQRTARVRGDVLPRHLGDDPPAHAEEIADLVERRRRCVQQRAVAQDAHLLPGEPQEQVLQLLGVAAEPRVVPERGPPGRGPGVLLGAGADEVADRFQPGRPQVGPVRMRPLDRVPQDHDHLDPRDQLADAALRVAVIKIEGRRLAAQGARRGAREQRLVVGAPPHVLPVGLHVARPAAAVRRRPVGEEELRFLDGRQVQARVSGQRGMECGGACLGSTDHQEIRQGHGRPSSARWRVYLDYSDLINRISRVPGKRQSMPNQCGSNPVRSVSAVTFPRAPA